jgi:hypothetical protein
MAGMPWAIGCIWIEMARREVNGAYDQIWDKMEKRDLNYVIDFGEALDLTLFQ